MNQQNVAVEGLVYLLRIVSADSPITFDSFTEVHATRESAFKSLDEFIRENWEDNVYTDDLEDVPAPEVIGDAERQQFFDVYGQYSLEAFEVLNLKTGNQS